MMRVADYIVERLHAAGVEHLFMVTGRGNLFLSDAVARQKGLRGICVHHEQSAAFAAMASAQCSGRIGACLVSTGCASTNAITGLLCAWQDGVPCVFLSGQNKLAETTRHTGLPLRTFGQQEADIVRIVEPLTKYATMLSDADRVAYELDKALHLATEGRQGPVWIDVPLDIQNMRVEPEALERYQPEGGGPLAPTAEDIAEVVQALRQAERPALLVGSGVRSAGALDELRRLVDRTRIPVTCAPSAVDAYGAEHALSIGAVGSLGATRAGNFTVQNSDLLLVLGHRLSSMTTGEEPAKFARAARVIVVDIDAVEHRKPVARIDRLVHADARAFLTALLAEELPRVDSAWVEACLHWKQVFPRCEPRFRHPGRADLHHLAEVLSDVLPADAVLVTDSGLTELIVPSTVRLRDGQRCVHPTAQGAMGYALPAAIGAYLATRREVVVVVGDGSIMMNLQELQTIHYLQLPIRILVVNNNGYAVIRSRQVELFRSRTIGTDPDNGVSCPDFARTAAGFALAYRRIEDSERLEPELRELLAGPGPVLCEILCVPDQVYLHSSYAHNAQRRVVRRPLEDQAPFLDREVFRSEMIVDPIDQ